MKTRVILICTVFLYFVSQSAITLGQDSIRTNIRIAQIRLDGNSGEQEVSLPLRDSLEYINFEITAVLISGELTIELFDPAGEKYGNFSLAGTSVPDEKPVTEMVRGKTYRPKASGSLVRYVILPKRGMWKARVTKKNAVGGVEFYLTRGVTVIKLN